MMPTICAASITSSAPTHFSDIMTKASYTDAVGAMV
jgi:hypothetical protein